ncbi:C2H2-type domain-containing protein [Trichostrongylus colubriformis]|uniref:C2H2-type domain-containing protein n=1 Tax=Trichostrongylus colubriformis TaxID=6319 RepID=A0AAN8J1N7_TRICO
MSDDEGRLLIDDIQDGPGSIEHELPASTLVDIKSAQGDAENTSINKLSTPLTVPVFGQPQVTSSGEVHLHNSTASNVQRSEPFAFTNNIIKIHGEQETTNNTSSPKHRKRPQQESSSSVFAPRSDNSHSLATTPRSSFNSVQGDSSANGKRQKRYKTNGISKVRNETLSSRKRKDSEHNHTDSPVESEETTSKKHKPLLRDRGTCVHSKAVQSEMDCSLFDLEVGATRLVEMTVVCKMENNELYVVARWKDQEFSGILTDGHPPAYLPYMKKRSTTVAGSGSNSSNGSACGDTNDRTTGSGASTPSKSRQQPPTPRDSKKRVPSSETKRKLSCSITRPGSSVDPPDDDEDVDVDIPSNGSISNLDSFKLVEVPGRKSMHICPVDGCQHRYSRSEEMEYHRATVHAKKAVMYEAICCQTDISAFRRRSVETDVEGLMHSESPCPSNTLEEAHVKNENSASTSMETDVKPEEPPKSPAGYSDISDDGVAPQLQKEEPTSDMRTPLLISTGLPSSSVTEAANVLTSPEFAPSPREAAPESLPPTPQQPKVSRPSSMPMAPATPTPLPSSFQPVSAERNRGAMNGAAVNPIVNAAVTPTPISAIPATRLPVTPSPGGLYMPSFAHQMMPPYAPQLAPSTPTATAAASPQQQQQQLNKMSQQHLKASDEAAASAGVLSAAKPMQSPSAQNLQRQFGMQMMQSGTGQHQAAMMQAAAAQAQMAQMHHLYMQQMAAGARGAQYPMAGSSAGAHEMAQLVALQALQQQQQNHFASMFQQK